MAGAPARAQRDLVRFVLASARLLVAVAVAFAEH